MVSLIKNGGSILKNKKNFVIIPHKLIKDKNLNPTDKIVYASLRSYVENDHATSGSKFIKFPLEIIKQEGLTNRDKSIYMTLKTFANSKGICFPSREVIAEQEGVTPRTVTSSIGRLEKTEYIKRNFRFNGSTVYQFLK